jgi:hypothetical protein
VARALDDHCIKLRCVLAIDFKIRRIQVCIDRLDRNFDFFQRRTWRVGEDAFEYRDSRLRLT